MSIRSSAAKPSGLLCGPCRRQVVNFLLLVICTCGLLIIAGCAPLPTKDANYPVADVGSVAEFAQFVIGLPALDNSGLRNVRSASWVTVGGDMKIGYIVVRTGAGERLRFGPLATTLAEDALRLVRALRVGPRQGWMRAGANGVGPREHVTVVQWSGRPCSNFGELVGHVYVERGRACELWWHPSLRRSHVAGSIADALASQARMSIPTCASGFEPASRRRDHWGWAAMALSIVRSGNALKVIDESDLHGRGVQLEYVSRQWQPAKDTAQCVPDSTAAAQSAAVIFDFVQAVVFFEWLQSNDVLAQLHIGGASAKAAPCCLFVGAQPSFDVPSSYVKLTTAIESGLLSKINSSLRDIYASGTTLGDVVDLAGLLAKIESYERTAAHASTFGMTSMDSLLKCAATRRPRSINLDGLAVPPLGCARQQEQVTADNAPLTESQSAARSNLLRSIRELLAFTNRQLGVEPLVEKLPANDRRNLLLEGLAKIDDQTAIRSGSTSGRPALSQKLEYLQAKDPALAGLYALITHYCHIKIQHAQSLVFD